MEDDFGSSKTLTNKKPKRKTIRPRREDKKEDERKQAEISKQEELFQQKLKEVVSEKHLEDLEKKFQEENQMKYLNRLKTDNNSQIKTYKSELKANWKKQSDSEVTKSNNEMFNISKNQSYKEECFDEKSGTESRKSFQSSSSQRSILKTKLVEAKVQYYKPLKKNMSEHVNRPYALNKSYVQKHKANVNNSIQNQLESHSRSRSRNKKSLSIEKKEMHNTIFVGNNKVLIRSIVNNKSKINEKSQTWSQLRAKKIKNKMIKDNLTNNKVKKGGTNQNLDVEESQKMMKKILEEEKKLELLNLNKIKRSMNLTAKFLEKSRKAALPRKEYLNKEKCNSRVCEKTFKEDGDLQIKKKDEYDQKKKLTKPLSSTQIRKMIEKQEEGELQQKQIHFNKIKFKHAAKPISKSAIVISPKKISESQLKLDFLKNKAFSIDHDDIKEGKDQVLVKARNDSGTNENETEEFDEDDELDFKSNKLSKVSNADDTDEIREETEYNTEEEDEMLKKKNSDSIEAKDIEKEMAEKKESKGDNGTLSVVNAEVQNRNQEEQSLISNNLQNKEEMEQKSTLTKSNHFANLKQNKSIMLGKKRLKPLPKQDKETKEKGLTDDDEIDADGKSLLSFLIQPNNFFFD